MKGLAGLVVLGIVFQAEQCSVCKTPQWEEPGEQEVWKASSCEGAVEERQGACCKVQLDRREGAGTHRLLVGSEPVPHTW